MFTRCEPCRYLTQVTFQTLSMDIKLPIKFFLTFCIITGCAASEDNSSVTSKPFIASTCTLSNQNVRKPLRARIYVRNYYKRERMEGCMNPNGLSRGNVTTSESQSGVNNANPVTQRYLIQLSQKLSPKLNILNMRLDVYTSRKYTQPLDIVLVLHSLSGYTWTLNLANLISAVQTNKISSLKIIFTHKDSKLALEQMQLPNWRVVVDHVIPKVGNTKSYGQIFRWTENVLFSGMPLTLSVNFPSQFSQNGDETSDFDFVNTLDLTLLPESVKATGRCRKVNMSPLPLYKEDLSDFVMGIMDANIDDGFTSCHTKNVWAPDYKSVSKISKSGSNRTKTRIRLLQSLEVPPDIVKDLPHASLAVQLRVQTAPSSTSDDKNILVILNKSPVQFFIDLRGLNGKLLIHTDMNQMINFSSKVDSYQVEVDNNTSNPEEFIEKLVKRYDVDTVDSSWYIERIRLSRIPLVSDPTLFFDISLSPRPLKLCDMENLVVLQCFNTEDLSISLNAKTFENVGLKREWVLLGKERCMFSESEDGRWVRKFVLRSKDKECGTHRQNTGETVRLSNKIFIDCPLRMSKGLAPYPLNVYCNYATSDIDDLPPIEGNPSQPSNDRHLNLWRTWDGQKYAGPRPSISTKRQFTDQLKLELFEDEKLANKIVFHFSDVKSGQTLYARLQPLDQTVNYGLMVRDCYLSNTLKENNPLGYPRQYLIIKGCDMGVSFQWKVAESYRVKIFSFVTPRLSFFSMSPYIYLHCNVQSCNYIKTPGDRIKGLPKCWNQNFLCNVPETPATTHLVSVPLRNADDKDDYKAMEVSGDRDKRERNSKSVMKTVPLWGVVIIAAIAFLLGILFTCIMWFVHNHSGGHCDVGDRILNRGRGSRDRRRSGRSGGRCYGNKDVDSRMLMPTPAAQCRQLCLHRMMPRTYLEDGTVISEDNPNDVVARLLASRGMVDGSNPQGYAHNDGKDENDYYDSTSPANSSRVKNSHSISCTVCGEGSSSGFGTGNCSSCSAQTCSLVDENEPLRHLPPGLRPPATSDYQEQQDQQLYSHFASA